MSERYSHCKFPMWPEGAKPTHVYCNMKTAPGFPYCDVHAQKSYVGLAQKTESAEQTQDQAK